MTLVEFYCKNEGRLREQLQADLGQLDGAIEAAAVDRNQAELEKLTTRRNAVRDHLDLMDAIKIEQIVTAGINFPALPADFPALLKAAQTELEKWKKVEAAISTAISVASGVADDVSSIGKLVLKYGKYLL